MDRERRVRTERRNLCMQAYDRWKGFQPDLAVVRAAAANRDGTVPRPRVGTITPEQRARFQAREALRTAYESPPYRNVRVALERQIGATLDFTDLPPSEQALKAGRPVARIVTLPGAGLVPQGFATGFLIAPDLLLTNYHVFRTPDEAQEVGAQFLYERTHEGLREGVTFELDPARFFVNDKTLDYAVVAVGTTALNGSSALAQFRYLPLIGVKGKIVKGDPVSIIQHPGGGAKQYATVNNRLLDLRDDGFLLYETDTLEGSSGSPVFNQHWETIGLHHVGVPRIENGQLVLRNGQHVALDAEVDDADLIWVANEGVRVSAVVESLARQRLDRPSQRRILENLLARTRDPLRTVTELNDGIVVPSPPADNLASTNMATNVFQFSGPVTIQVSGPAAGSAADVLAITAEPPPEPPDGEFVEKVLVFDENYNSRSTRGYKATFLTGWNVPAPTVTSARSGELAKRAGKVWQIPYYHYSLVMNEHRRLVMWTASNVDYSTTARKHTKTRKEYGGENWRLDPRVALETPGLQIDNAEFYLPATKIDRGHIVRREDACWGNTAKEAEYGNSDTYHWTNCTPQSQAFNQSKVKGIWGKFEDHIEAQVKAEGGRMNVFAGPVLNPADPEHGYPNRPKIKVPMEFWKVVACVSKESGKSVKLSYGFVFDQTEPVQRLGFERMNMDDYEIYQLPLAEITKKTGVVFDASLLAADVLKSGGGTESVRGVRAKRITALEGVVLR